MGGYPIAAMLGQTVGGILAVTIIAILVEKAIFQRMLDNPVTSKVSSVFLAWLIAGTIGGFTFADGGDFAWRAFAIYGISAIIVGILFYHRGTQIREEMKLRQAEPDPELTRTFE